MKPIVAIVGRPNVGKSSLFNVIIGKKIAIVQDEPGVTRDRNYAEVEYKNKHFMLVDTGGFFIHSEEPILKEIKKQVELALEEADIVIAVFDGKEGLNPLDKELVEYLRKLRKPVFYVVNKIDHKSHELRLPEFYALGIEKIYPTSAEHGHGVYELLDELIEFLPETKFYEEKRYDSRVVVLGKPNVGKSSLINRLLGSERAIVSDVAGTTRDAIDSEVIFNNRTYLFVDTAGIRRKSRISLKLEKFSVMSAIRALERVDVAILVIDAYEGVSEQEQKIAQLIQEKGRGCIILMNKWDRVEKTDKTESFYKKMLQNTLPFVNYAPVIFGSALTGKNINRIFGEIDKVMNAMKRRVSTGVLNRIVSELQERNPMPIYKGKRVKIYYGTQQDINPPLFIFFSNYPEAVPSSHIKYIENQLREKYEFTGAPIKIIFRKKR
ncbi:MAG: ribosome biogenesis GTPase Der [Proteobacteria bacterium]|nr:ribosome biogenesis GTPase Der [Pseudomonadota bacterium]